MRTTSATKSSQSAYTGAERSRSRPEARLPACVVVGERTNRNPLDPILWGPDRQAEFVDQIGPIDEIDVQALKAAGVIGQAVRYAKVIKSGELSRKVVLKGITATAGARAAIEAAGGSLA